MSHRHAVLRLDTIGAGIVGVSSRQGSISTRVQNSVRPVVAESGQSFTAISSLLNDRSRRKEAFRIAISGYPFAKDRYTPSSGQMRSLDRQSHKTVRVEAASARRLRELCAVILKHSYMHRFNCAVIDFFSPH